MKKFVSIILPVYNSKKYIIKTINSILSQSYENFELVIIDDCSTDGTYQLIKKIKKNNNKIKLFQTSKNSKTPAIPRNIGLKKSKGEIICFIDSDDLWEKDKLKIQLKEFKSKKNIITTAAKYFSKNETSSLAVNLLRRFLQFFFIKKINLKGFQWLYLYDPIILSSVMIHREILLKNLFDENINAREDLDLWIRIREKKYKYIFLNQILVSISRRDGSLTSNLKKELVVLIHSLSNIYFKLKNFNRINFFLLGIIVKFFLTFIKINIKKIKTFLKTSVILIISFYFLIFYTPLFWYLGKPLLHYDDSKNVSKIKNVVLFSGHGSTSYYNITYRYRYIDLIGILKNNNNLENIFILGRIQEIPEQKILESLLINDGFDANKIQLIYDDYSNTFENIKNVHKILKERNIKEIIFVTSPYHSKRAKLSWSKFNDLKVKFWKGYEWPRKNNFFEYSKNKKIIIYEHLSILINRYKGNID